MYVYIYIYTHVYIHIPLSNSYAHPYFLGEISLFLQEINPKAVEDLKCPNLGVAALLAIEPMVWQQAWWQKKCLERYNVVPPNGISWFIALSNYGL